MCSVYPISPSFGRLKMKLINPEIRIETTNICNAHCIMCPREKLEREKGTMSIGLFKKIVDEVKDYGVENVHLGGFGEPLLDPYMVERVRYVKQYGMHSYCISNASLFNKKLSEQLMTAGLDEVRFSFYGLSKDVYEKVHVGLKFSESKKNIMNVIKLKKDLDLPNFKVCVFYLLLDENSHQLEQFKKEWEPLVDGIEIWCPYNIGDGRKYRDVNGDKESCNRPQRGPIQVLWDGRVVPCCMDYNGRMILGDLNKSSLKEILHNERFQSLRDAHNSGDFKAFPYCGNCDQLNKRPDVMIYSNRHNLSSAEAVKLTNSFFFNLKGS